MIKNYITFFPAVQGSLEEEWEQCYNQIFKKWSAENRPVKLNIFVDLPDYSSYLKTKKYFDTSVKKVFGVNCPAFNVTVNPPEKPWKVAVEAGFMETVSCEIISKFWHSAPYIVRTTDTTKEIWAGGLGSGLFPDNTRKAATAAFEQMRGILEAEQMSFDNIVRQWNFIGNILDVKSEHQNYQIFNEVRSENYHKYRYIHSYPAATGVGMKYGGVILDFCAIKAESSIKIIAVDNPDQIRPYDYSQQVLRGNPERGKEINQPPQFERAVLVADNLKSTLFVSGTASIVGQDTVGIDDVEKQTLVTLENIGKLTDSNRIRHLTGKADSDAGSLILLRVYIKRQNDFAKVKAICQEHYPDITAIYIEADICRQNLLVEIEAELFKAN